MKKALSLRLLSIIVITFSLLNINTSYSQSFIEQAGGISTSFKITSSGNKLQVQDQALLKRGLAEYRYDHGLDSGAAYGYAMEVWKLEFTTKKHIKEKEIPKEGRKKRYYQFDLYNLWGKSILKHKLDLSAIEQVSNGEELVTYSINLQSVPLILLDQAHEIRIDKINEK